jgi:sulfonate transport system permease protein
VVTSAVRLRRGLVGVATLAAVYGLVAQATRGFVPTSAWMAVHEVENVELLPTYASLAEEAAFLARAGILFQSMAVSAGRMLAGFLLGALAGIVLGLLMGRAAWVESVLEPWVALLRFTPALALLPLYVLWFGFGEGPKILLIATAVAVVGLQGAWEGVRGIPRVHLEAAAALGAARGLVLRRVVLPAALPRILSSLRIAIMLAWVTAVVAELIQPTMPSLGYLLALAGAYPRVPTMVVALGAIAVLVLVSDTLALAGYHRATRWMKRQHG